MTECSVDSLYIALGVAAAYPSVHAPNDFLVYRTLHEIAEAIGCAEDPHPAEWMARLADLIDPTCEMDDAGDVPASVKDNLNTFFCSECGAPVYNDMSPSYCLYCGARVVDGGDA